MENFEEIFSKRFLKFVKFTIKPQKKLKFPNLFLFFKFFLGFSLSLFGIIVKDYPIQ
jgi:hypothetical protein